MTTHIQTTLHYGLCQVRFIEHFATRFNPTKSKSYNRIFHGCDVTVKGKLATITLPSGKIIRKRLSTYGFSFEPEDICVETDKNLYINKQLTIDL